ncbi:hypothetical protein HDC94_000507 [Leifsonia sp. AK011]|uniref:NotI family restriction endonuclease n=1 Tax=Leifsonia sp. AK011 TaxID=2723075 RepID=UPI0015CBE097|nr:NotI family restriction endonuclease [Leifsonia sp. AK011]NYF09351.1 hypothetical protein [Leifsonia sp. AK011]
MAGTVYELFGFRAADTSQAALVAAHESHCPFLDDRCEKRLSDGVVSGVCTVKPVTSPPVICCPVRLYAEDYRILRDVADRAFSPGLSLQPGRTAVEHAQTNGEAVVAVFGKRWGGELRLPQKDGINSYFVDWILALLDKEGALVEFVAIEVQTIDTTGNYRASRAALLTETRDIVQSTVGLNWENVNKRILPQLIYKGQILQREELCRKGLFFVCPTPIYDRIMRRLGGASGLVKYALQPASITFLPYDLNLFEPAINGQPLPLKADAHHSTTVYKVQEAFNNVTLPDENVYKNAIETALGVPMGGSTDDLWTQ